MDKFYILSFCITYNSKQWPALFAEIEKFMQVNSTLISNKMVLPRWTRGDYVRVVVETDGTTIAELQETVHSYWTNFLEEHPSASYEAKKGNPFYENYPENSLLYFGGHPIYSQNSLMPFARNIGDKLRKLISFTSDMAISFGKEHQVKSNLNRFFYPALLIHRLAQYAPEREGNILARMEENATPHIEEEKLNVMQNQLNANCKQLAQPFGVSLNKMIEADTTIGEFCREFWQDNTLERIEDLNTLLHIFGITKYEEQLLLKLLASYNSIEHQQIHCA